MKFIDLARSPYKNSAVRNGFRSIEEKKVISKKIGRRVYPYCVRHGAMNKVDPSGLWRCLMCNEGCYQKR